eukprot:Transcript_5039.p1 GENE.Transcript_5039~~Transcript_5039.p1  ORF type:complete len:112 (+),score=37.75 Transcript_5039:141-476(+)
MSRSLLQADEHTELWFALRVRNHGNKEMNQTELNGYTMKLTARHQRSDCNPIVVETSFLAGVAWMRPALDEPGKWTCSAAIEKDGVVVGNPFSVTLTVKKGELLRDSTLRS